MRSEKKKKNQSKLELKKLQRVKAINYILKGKVLIVVLTVGLIKKTQYKRENIFSRKSPVGRVKVGLDFSNDTKRADLKNATGADK